MRFKYHSNLHLVINSVIDGGHCHKNCADLVLRDSFSNSLGREFVSFSGELSIGGLVQVLTVSIDSHIRISVGSVVDPGTSRV